MVIHQSLVQPGPFPTRAVLWRHPMLSLEPSDWTDGHMVHPPDTALTYLHFVLNKDRHIKWALTLVCKQNTPSCWCQKAAGKLFSRQLTISQWCASWLECQLVNQPAIPKVTLRSLPLMDVLFECIDMDLFRPSHRSAHRYRFALFLMDYARWYPETVPLQRVWCRHTGHLPSRLCLAR